MALRNFGCPVPLVVAFVPQASSTKYQALYHFHTVPTFGTQNRAHAIDRFADRVALGSITTGEGS